MAGSGYDYHIIHTTPSDHRAVATPQQGQFSGPVTRQVIFTFPITAAYGLTGAILSSAIIFLYDGTQGCIKGAAAKYSFYAFYPIHLYIIYLLT